MSFVEQVHTVRFKRIDIEETVAAQRNTGQHTVVDRTLQHIEILAVAGQQKKPVVPQGIRDGRAGFVVRLRVRQLIRLAHRLATVAGAETARDRHLPSGHVLPHRVNRTPVGRVAQQRGDVGHPAQHVGRANRMTDDLPLLNHRHVVGVLRCRDPLAAPPALQDKTREIQIRPRTGDPVQFHQCKFDLLVAGGNIQFPRPPDRGHKIRALDRHIEQGAFAGRLIMRDGRLVQMADIIKLMTVAVIAFQTAAVIQPPFRAGDPRRVIGMDGARRVQITVRLLRGRDLGNQLVQIRIQFRIGRQRETIGCALDHFVDIRIVKRRPAELAGHQAAGFRKVVDASGLFAFFERIPDGHGMIGLEPVPPEPGPQLDRRERQRPHRIIRPVMSSGRQSPQNQPHAPFHFFHDHFPRMPVTVSENARTVMSHNHVKGFTLCRGFGKSAPLRCGCERGAFRKCA